MRKYALKEIQSDTQSIWIGGRGNTFDDLDKAKARAQEYANRWKTTVGVWENKIGGIQICRMESAASTVCH